jgi:DivIVA domain-containing protein
MWWLFAIVIVIVMGVLGAVAAGKGGSMPQAYSDKPDATVPDGDITAADLASVRFTTSLRGYRMSEVDDLLDRLAAQLGATPEDIEAPHAGADGVQPKVDEG